MPKAFTNQIEIVPDYEIQRYVKENKGSYTAWVGAGTSVEAGIKTASEICEEIRKELVSYAKPADEDAWARAELNWDDPYRRYATCLKKYGPAAANRVSYFRRLIGGLQPAFSHHAIALLMESGFLKKTCLTTNFDKLLEIAFAQQGYSEYQAIRSDEEATFWHNEKNKNYIVKLHGDYDTHNILNTVDETVVIPAKLSFVASNALKQGGLIALGSSGYEDSVIRLLNDLLEASKNEPGLLNRGLFWGVYLSGVRETNAKSMEEGVIKAIEKGGVSQKLVEVMDRMLGLRRPCAFFPIWGAGNFLFDLVQSTKRKAIIGRAERYLDHTMRLRHVFAQGGLKASAIEKRLDSLAKKKARERKDERELNLRAQVPTKIWEAQGKKSSIKIEVLYGDITSRSMMDSVKSSSIRKAVISPDDNFVSASGGAALALLKKAGQHNVLNELSKFQNVHHREILVTSGGELPAHYIFHAAATELDLNGNSRITAEDVVSTIRSALEMALSLQVTCIFVPLIGAGEHLVATEAFDAILQASKTFANSHSGYQLQLLIVIFDEGILGRKDVGVSLKRALGTGYAFRALSA